MTEPPIARVRQIMPAPPDVVFDEWLDPDSLMDWMCPRPVRCVEISVEARVGGIFRFDVDELGVPVLVSGQYLAVERPRLLRFTWSVSKWSDPTTVSIVEVTFEPVGDDETLMAIEHSLLPSEALDDHQHGWDLTGEQLAAVLRRR